MVARTAAVFVAVLLATASLSVARADDATAQPDDAKARAAVLARTAVDLGRAGSHAEALILFERAYALDPAPVLLYNIARVAEAAGQIRKAVDSLKVFLVVEPSSEKRAKAQQALEVLLPRLPATVRVQCAIDGAVVDVDGKPEGRTPLAAPIEVSPGSHTIDVLAPGREAFRQVIDVKASEALDVHVTLLEKVEKSAGPERVAPAPSLPASTADGEPSTDDAALMDAVNETAAMNADLERILDAVSARLPSFVSVRCPVDDAVVEVDGRVVGHTPLTGPIKVRAGRHVIRVLPRVGDPIEATLDVAAGEAVEFEASPSTKESPR